ncbi:hypothetical protein GF406_13795 [candidate division KSB1 bacterium]|nr:hypothetical protein [candidate division KSB1 bacterium]
MSVERWRFINSEARSGALNMAIDRLLADKGQPCLRVYGWNPPAISLGFHQPVHEVDFVKCHQDNIDIVLRPTGGRAVLHARELTYAVVLPQSSPFYESRVLPVYETISKAIIASLKLLDLPVEWKPSQKTLNNLSKGALASICYASTVQYEIGFQGKKLVGSAQRRIGGAVLQHGSMLIGDKHLDLPFYLKRGDDRYKKMIHEVMRKHTICLDQISHSRISYAQLAMALRQGFASCLDIEFYDQPLTAEELLLGEQNAGAYVPSEETHE